MIGKLTKAKVKAAQKPGRYADGNTLYLYVTPTGSKSWVQRLTVNGRRCDIGLGPWPVVTLAEARDVALDNRRLVRDGGDPLVGKRKASIPTFRDATVATFEANKARWRSAKVTATWMQQMERHVLPALGDMRVDHVDRGDVLAILTPMWTVKPEIARKLRQRMRAVLAWAEAHGHVDRNVAGEAIDGALPTMPSVKQHFRALPHPDVADALETIADSKASMAAKACLRFVVLTAVRSGEARLATWDEIDLDARIWRIPAERMKAGAEHRVPLTDEAADLLREVAPLRDDSGLVFPSPRRRGASLSDMTLTKVLRDTGLGERCVVHGFRSSFRDWCADTGKPREIAEAALAHTVQGVEGAYFRSDLFERRRDLMNSWSRYITGTGGTVVKLHG